MIGSLMYALRRWHVFAWAGFLAALIGALNVAFGFSSDASIGLAAALLLWLAIALVRGVDTFVEWPRDSWWRDYDLEELEPRINARDPSEELLLREGARALGRRFTLTRVGLVVGIGASVVTIVDGIIDLITKVA
jgi:hypothetical protein